MLSGDNSILSKAGEARDITYEETTIEQKKLENLEDIINEMQTGVRARNIGRYIYYEKDINGDNLYNNDWRVFYEENNITYLIASDYILVNTIPSEFDTTTNGPYNVWWNNNSSTGAADISIRAASKYKLSWLKDNSQSTNRNAKYTADLLSTELWNSFALYEGIEAIGSPTLEMLIASWNAKGYVKFYWDYVENGYSIGTEENPTTTNVNPYQLGDEGYYDTLYFPHINTEVEDNYLGCKGYTLASPHKNGKSNICCVFSNGGIGSTSTGGHAYSIRPVIAIPSNMIGEDSNSGMNIYFIN